MATQEKKWNVANRLHSLKDSDNPEVNHIIAGADEIYDDAKGAKQSDINAQTDAALADRYTKAETYSKEQLDALITTPDVNYVTVATFADLPQTGEADTIYRVSSYDGTQVDASKYALYAWNGATYQLLAVRSAVGEVFDVSEYNTGATYETLTAALAAVPASVQRGGMSIKFIQFTPATYSVVKTEGITEQPTGTEVQEAFSVGTGSYTAEQLSGITLPSAVGNSVTYWMAVTADEVTTYTTWVVKYESAEKQEYVQYRLMKPDWSDDDADWQGIDDEPTAGSRNLVESGGVVEFVRKSLYDQQVYSQSDFEMTGYSAGYQSLGGTLKAGVEYKIAIRLTGFDTNIPTVYTLYKTGTSHAYKISITDLVLNSLINEREAVITITPEIDVSYIFMRMINSGTIPPEGNHVYVDTYTFDDKFLRVDEQSLTPAQQAKVKENIGLVIKDVFDEESDSLSTDAAIADYVKDVASDAAGTLNTETAVLTRNNTKLQETMLLGKPDSVKYFLDNYSYYEQCIDELYIIPNVPNIVFKYYSNRLFVRALDRSSTTGYKWHSVTYVDTIENDKIVELKVTLAGSDENYPIDTTIGYVIFKDIESFINNPVGPYVATLVDGVANEITYSPKIAMSLGYYNSTPIITGDKIYIPYKIKNQTIDELEQKIDDIKPSQKSLNILFIGNSYTANSVSYVPFILKNVCPTLKFRIGVLFLNGGKLSEHLANILNEDVVNEDSETISPQNYNKYSYITDEMNHWGHYSTNITIFMGLDDATWDIVSTHNANRYVVREWSECYAPFIFRLHKAIADYLKYPVKFGWDLTHSSNTSSVEEDVTKFMASVDKAEKTEQLTCTEIVFPYGTAVQNLRTIPAMQALGDGSHGNLLIDNSHLQSGIGQLAASYAVAIKLLEQVGCTAKVVAESTFPTTEWVQAISTIRGADIGTGSIGVTEHNCFLAQVAAIQAVKKPYEVTDINEYDINED